MGKNEEVLENEITADLEQNVEEIAENIEEVVNDAEIEETVEGAEAKETTENTEEIANDTKIEEITEDETPVKKQFNWKKILVVCGITIGVLAVIYGAGVLYYSNHFFFNTQIGNFNCSNMSVEKATEKIKNGIENYEFTLIGRNDVQEVVTGEEIHMECSSIGNLDELKKKQWPYEWITARNSRKLPLDIEVTFEKGTLYNRITQLAFSAETRKNIEGLSGDIYYENGKYQVKDDGSKNIISINKVYQTAKQKISDLSEGMTLDDEGCYVALADEDTIKGVLNLTNKYVGTEVTYIRGDEKNILDGETINKWISIDDKYSVKIDDSKIREYVDNLVKSYDTVGKERKFKTSNGEEITVSGGNYGWLTDSEKETQALSEIIKNGEKVSREPIYKKTAAAHGINNDLANTYVEISIAGQHLWFYKDGNLIVSTDFVSGDPTKGNATPTGMYFLNYKEKDTVLVGEDYRSPVKFWMPFNGGIGLHDASWRGRFGGSIYNGGGSHGCVNLPYSAAAKIYENISSGDPVVVY